MLDPTPAWTFSSKKPLTQWYGHVHLMPDHVLGQWVCLRRSSGELLWRSNVLRPNTFCGEESGVIVASEMRSDGPWTASFGCYGISFKTGELLWTSHRSGFWGRVIRLLDFVPGFTNDLRDSPHHVREGKVFCNSGRVLDVQTGIEVQKVDPKSVQSYQKQITIGRQFYDSGLETVHPRVEVEDGLYLRHAHATAGMQRDSLKITAETESRNEVWRFSTDDHQRHIDGNFYSYRVVPPYMYLVVSNEPNYKPHPTKKHFALPNSTHWHLMTVDLATGCVVQEFSLGDEPLNECRIEDVDADGLLIGRSDQVLAYFCRATER